jgi:flagellar hook assembly protein FlgD
LVPWLTATTLTTDVWLGTDGHGYAFRVRATDSHGNAGAWNVTAKGSAAPALVVGGFGRVTLDGLAYRTGPSTSAARLGTLPVNTVVALTSGPVSSGGYTWFEVTQPIREWAPVSFVERGVWIAIRSSTASFVAAYHAPNAVTVNAGITRLDFAGGGATGASAAAARTFSPNGDGARDALAVRWTNTLAMASMTLNVYRADGSPAGSEAMPGRTAAAHVWTWNGRIGSTRLPDGRYVLQLVGTAGTRSYRAPSSRPATSRQLATFGVTIDTVPPVIGSVTTSASVISPNGDGTRDSVTYRLSAPGATRWTIRIAAGSAAPVRSTGAAGGTATFTWKGTNDAGAVVPNGRYAATLAACDVAGNCATRAFAITVDTTPPVITRSAAPAAFSPNGDGSADTVALRWTANEKATGTARVWRGTTLVRSWTFSGVTGGAITWNGRTAVGTAVADGRYTFKVDARDAVGNRTVVTTPVVVDRTAGFLRWSRPFYPQDGDALVPTSTLRWTLARSATTTLAIYDAKGTLVRMVWAGRVQSAGARSWTWDGKLANGTRAPQGRYTAGLTVTSPYSRQVLVRAVWATAFVPKLSAATVSAGRVLTVAFTSVEPLSTRPTVTFTQPGRAAVTVAATKLADGSWRAQFTVRAGPAGAGSIRIAAKDSAGHVNATVVAIAVAS